jgi:hypothetical protein
MFLRESLPWLTWHARCTTSTSSRILPSRSSDSVSLSSSARVQVATARFMRSIARCAFFRPSWVFSGEWSLLWFTDLPLCFMSAR